MQHLLFLSCMLLSFAAMPNYHQGQQNFLELTDEISEVDGQNFLELTEPSKNVGYYTRQYDSFDKLALYGEGEDSDLGAQFRYLLRYLRDTKII